jgi:hypothetical protein
MRRLDFLNPVFKDGINKTVRYGAKWGDVHMGEEIEVGETNGPVVGNAVIAGIVRMKFNQIEDAFISDEHDPECTTVAGLRNAMVRAYGDNFKDDGDVVILSFEVTK